MTPLCTAEALPSGAGRDGRVATTYGTVDLAQSVSLGVTSNGPDD